MNKKLAAYIILSSLVLGAVGSLIMTRVIIPKLAALPFLVRHNLAPAPGPLVINTTQEVRVTDGTDVIAAIQRVEPWTVAVLGKDSAGNVQVLGSGLLLTSDGLIATTKTVLGTQTQLWAKAWDGTTAAATIVSADPASDLVLIQAALKNQPSAAFVDASKVQLGDRAVSVSEGNGQTQAQVDVTYVASLPSNISASTVFNSDRINSTMSIGPETNSTEGATLAESTGEVIGLYSKNGVILAGTIQSALDSFFNNSNKIVRPGIGIHYEFITPEISAITGMRQGVLVKRPDPKTPAVVVGSAAAQSGIQEGDVIFKVNNIQIDATHSFDSLLFAQKPNNVLTLELIRGGNDVVVTVIATQQ